MRHSISKILTNNHSTLRYMRSVITDYTDYTEVSRSSWLFARPLRGLRYWCRIYLVNVLPFFILFRFYFSRFVLIPFPILRSPFVEIRWFEKNVAKKKSVSKVLFASFFEYYLSTFFVLVICQDRFIEDWNSSVEHVDTECWGKTSFFLLEV